MLLFNQWVLRNKWIYYYKKELNSSILQHKTWWIVKEFEQQFKIDYKEIFIIAVFYNYKLKQINIKMTFLHNDLKEEVYMI